VCASCKFPCALAITLAVLATGMLAGTTAAHEIPADVRLYAFLKPAGNRLDLLVRLPMAALIDVEIPQRGPGFIEISRADEALRAAVKLYLTDNITIYENDAPLPEPRVAEALISLPSDRSFASYQEAFAHLHGPRLADSVDLIWNQQLLDVLLEYPIRSDRSELAIGWRVDRLGRNVSTVLRFLPPGGAERAFEFSGDPGVVHLDPRWHQAAIRFALSGLQHILGGIDHLLFLLCLVIPFRRLRPLVIIVTAFTVAHSISLLAAVLGFVPDALWFPPLIETLIAVTIVYVALENIVYAAAGGAIAGAVSRRWITAFAFGLVHGFGFSFALRQWLQFAGSHLFSSLLAFNIGVEVGQIAVLIVLIPMLDLLFRYVLPERVGIIILSALVLHTAWHWMIERGEQLARFPLPRIDAAFVVGAMRGLMAMLALAAGVLLANTLLRRWTTADDLPRAPRPASRQGSSA